MAFIDPTYREQSGPDAEIARRQSDLLSRYFNQPWISYTPTFTGFTLGNGTCDARYKRLGSTCFGRMVVTFGSTSAWTAAFTVTLPFPAPAADFRYVGTWVGFHVTNVIQPASAQLNASTTQVRFNYPNTWPAGSLFTVSSGSPWAWANTDNFDFQFCYEVGK